MDSRSFQPGAPGTLVQTTAWEKRVRDGVVESVPVQSLAYVPNPLPPKLDRDAFIGRVSGELLAAEANLARLEGTVGNLPNASLLLRPLRLREAKLSSRIEDTLATAEEVALLEEDRPTARDEVREVWNYLEALNYGLSTDLPLGVRLFRELHAILLKGVRGDEKRPGEFRSIQVQIGGQPNNIASARFVPPPPGEPLRQCLDDFERYVNIDGLRASERGADIVRYPRIIETAMAHYQFECIHPFVDGNGRLGRLIVAISLCRQHLVARPLVYVSAHFDRHRQTYYDLLLRVSTHGDWETWVRFFCTAVNEQAEDAIHRARALQSLRQRYVEAVTTKRASALAHKLIDYLFAHPAVDAARVARHLDVTPTTAQSHINRLIDCGILVEVTGGSYGRRYVARAILQVAEEDSLPVPG